MSQAVLTLTGTGAAEWAPTPGGTSDADHYTLCAPGNDATFVTNGGHVNGFVEEFFMSAGPGSINLVTNVNVAMRASGLTVSSTPAFRIQILVNDVVVGSREFGGDTGGVMSNMSINVPVNVLGAQWTAGPRKVKFIPLDGNAGYGPIPNEED